MNVINRNLNGPPTQGRRRECARRLRQQQKAHDRTLVEVFSEMPDDTVSALLMLDDAQCGFVEDQIEQAAVTQETKPAPRRVAGAGVVAAMLAASRVST